MRFSALLLIAFLLLSNHASAQPVIRWSTFTSEYELVRKQLNEFVSQMPQEEPDQSLGSQIDVTTLWKGSVGDVELTVFQFTENDTLQDGTLKEPYSIRINGIALSTKKEHWEIAHFMNTHNRTNALSTSFKVVTPDSLSSKNTLAITLYETSHNYHCDDAEEPENAKSHNPWNCTTWENVFFYITKSGNLKKLR